MKLYVFLPALIAFIISAIAGHFAVPYLKKLKFGQYIREEGPEAHKKKSGTPTMGGIIFLISITAVTFIFVKGHTQALPVLFVTLAYGAIGFVDDYIKVVKKRNLGLTSKQKLAMQFVVAAVFAIYITIKGNPEVGMLVPFTGNILTGTYLRLPVWLYFICLMIIMVGTVNASNFTDGLDGLLSSVTAIIAVFLSLAAAFNGSGITTICSAVVGGLLGFLLYNVHPAKVFMGDTGSLALGGFVAAAAYMMNMAIFIIIIAFIYFLEIVSVMIQVVYFKKTGGKRFFKMTPIHHHFELSGWHETKVVAVFSIFTAVLCIIGFIAMM
ncbi:MAG: phospho-N-acetylmuramoyl-pentapeptide-transferase [Lachnospiraceae bacterium]|nr:phospho-N-acetylmuramoyl-pentapeptide-transferase [Lachnospiraceae bacterium]